MVSETVTHIGADFRVFFRRKAIIIRRFILLFIPLFTPLFASLFMPTPTDLFHDDDGAAASLPIDPIGGALQFVKCTFSPDFWRALVARMVAQATTPLQRQLLIVPDNSMILAYRSAWAAHARATQTATLMPPLMTLMDWAKANGAEDWDAHDTERMLNWMQVLPQAQVLREALGQQIERSDDLLGLARQLIDMSDELSIHLLAGRDVQWVKNSVEQAIASVYQRQTHRIAQQELAILLHCWQADVDKQTPVVRYLAVLQQMGRGEPRPYDCVWVLRNRPWTAHETDFWQRYAQHTRVCVLDIQAVQVRVGKQRQAAITRIAGELAPRWSGDGTDDLADVASDIQFFRAHNLEDEAQTIVRQVLRWRAQGLRQIALVALDRQVSRRVWALLRRVGVDIRDDTGWLLSTSRAASAWFNGLQLLHEAVLAKDLMQWLSHPMVLAHWSNERKAAALAVLYTLADRQQRYQQTRVWRTWDDWLEELAYVKTRALAPAGLNANEMPAACADVQDVLTQAKSQHHRWQTPRTLSVWAQELVVWAKQFGLWTVLEQDNAGQLWCELLRRWSWVANDAPLSFATLLRLMNTEVERLTYRPPSLSGDTTQNAEEVILLPLGNTRLRTFDAVWLLGADAGNLPGAELDSGLLNWAVRQDLGLPTVQDKQRQMRTALLDIFALNAQVCASYAAQKDGTPNALSPWLQQYLRAQGGEVLDTERIENAVAPQVQPRSAATVAQHLPRQISATDLTRLAACPYQYHAKTVLQMAPHEWPSEEVCPSDKGNLWHSVVEHFHRRRDAAAPEQDLSVFAQIVDECLLPLCADNPRYWAVQQQFHGYGGAFVAWWQAREGEGWQVKHSEYAPQMTNVTNATNDANDANDANDTNAACTQSIVNAAGQTVHELHWRGRIDQVDERINALGEAEWSLIDYKTNDVRGYQQAIRNHEDTQLAFYINLMESAPAARLTHQQIVDARYVGVDRHAERTLPEAILGDAAHIQQQARQLREQVQQVFLQMAQGAPLVAFGEKSACVYCDYRAVCRKDYAASTLASELVQGGAS